MHIVSTWLHYLCDGGRSTWERKNRPCALQGTKTHFRSKGKTNKKLVDVNNADAFQQLAEYYANGIRGMPQDYEKADELCLRCTEAYCNSGALHMTMGVCGNEQEES